MDIEVMYADRDANDLHIRVKVPIERITELSRERVIAIAMTHDGILCGRAWGRWARDLPEGLHYGTDRMAFVRTADGNWYIDCWDDTELTHSGRSMADPNGARVNSPAAPRRHAGESSVTFSGFYLPEAKWLEAKTQMNAHMGAPR